jgi:GTP-binding protein HflX
VFVENRLFATLDPTTRLVGLTPGLDILVTDTVGFIRKLPHHLVASFKSTLEEITEADFLLHVVDVSSPLINEHTNVVRETLEEIGVKEKPTLMVFNKVDRLADRSVIQTLSKEYQNAVFISASRGINILGLKESVVKLLNDEFVESQITVSQADQKLISHLYEIGEVLEVTYEDNSVLMKIRIPKKDSLRIHRLVQQHQARSTPPENGDHE